MRLSCNGCRVLRKCCNNKCSIKLCLDWIKCPQPQANATLFLAKFYGRAALLNLLNAAPLHLRPAVFRSLLYDACGWIFNPIYVSTGLLWSGNWHLCQAAVEAAGAPIAKVAVDSTPPLMAYDIRHVSKDENSVSRRQYKVRFKKSTTKPKPRAESPDVDSAARVIWSWCHKEECIIGSRAVTWTEPSLRVAKLTARLWRWWKCLWQSRVKWEPVAISLQCWSTDSGI